MAETENLFDFPITGTHRRHMLTRIFLVTLTAFFVVPFAFGQMKYSRSRASSPTPSPTASPTPQQKMYVQPLSNQKPAFIPSQKPGSVPTQSPAPAQVQGKQMPAQQPRATQMAQPKAGAFSARVQPTPALAVIPPKAAATPAPIPVKPTPTPVPPPDVKAYLDKQIASSKDQKFHMNVNGKDLALTPFHVWSQKSTGVGTTSTSIDMRSDEGKVYDIEFVTTGSQVSSIRIHRINGEAVR